MNGLKIIVSFQQLPGHTFGEMPIVLPPHILEVRITFELLCPYGELVRRVTIVMEARHYDQGEECLRDELKQSAYANHDMFADTCGHIDPDDHEWAIEIIDPHGVLKWFGIDQAADLFKQHQKQHDKPLRLPAPPVK